MVAGRMRVADFSMPLRSCTRWTFRAFAFRDQQAIGDAEFGLKQPGGLECIERRSLGAGEWLAIEHVHDGIDRVALILKRRIKSKLHAAAHTVRKTLSDWSACSRALNA